MSNFHDQRTSTARKSHICSLCGQEIPVGEKYERWTGKWCGDFYNQHFHLSYCDILQEYAISSGEEEWSADCMHDWLYDECCRSCRKEDCQLNVFRCGKVLNQMFKKRAISMILNSLQNNLEELQNRHPEYTSKGGI